MMRIVEISLNDFLSFIQHEHANTDPSAYTERSYHRMTAVSTVFQTLCEQLILEVSSEKLDRFLEADTDLERIKLLYNDAIKIPVQMEPCGKNLDEAAAKKVAGNQRFEEKKLREALDCYNSGLLICPADDAKSQSLMSVIMANRSAVLFDLHLYREVVNDIDWVHKSGWYPINLKHKTIFRKAKALIFLNVLQEARELLEELLNQATAYRLPRPKVREIQALIETTRIVRKDVDPPEDQGIPQVFVPNPMYPAASQHVTFRQDNMQGRFAVAIADIPPGAVILQEEPHAFVLSQNSSLRNCVHCAKHTLNPLVCFSCSTTLYCSDACRTAAAKYHQYECGIVQSIYKSGASINCFMALRIITKSSFDNFWTTKDAMECQENSVYSGDDYRRLYNLCTHADRRNKVEFVHYSFMAIYMLRLLKTTNYFPFETTDALKEEEAYIASLILRHLQLLQFNAHELSELRNTDLLVPYENAHVGGGIYPTLSLFNHSCEPSIIRYNKGTKMVARTIKKINAGDIIYENYGPIYSGEIITERQKKMNERYWFDCNCTPCRQNWPLFRLMDENVIPLKCPKCKGLLPVNRNNSNPEVRCSTCKKNVFIFNSIMKLMQVDNATSQAEENFVAGNYETAISFYRTALETFAEHMTPPFPDLVKVQQRLRICMLHDGNKEVLYEKPSTFLTADSKV